MGQRWSCSSISARAWPPSDLRDVLAIEDLRLRTNPLPHSASGVSSALDRRRRNSLSPNRPAQHHRSCALTGSGYGGPRHRCRLLSSVGPRLRLRNDEAHPPLIDRCGWPCCTSSTESPKVRHLESTSGAMLVRPSRSESGLRISATEPCSTPSPAPHGRHDAGDWEFESISLQRRVQCEPDFLDPSCGAAG
jgi:hypothetical protein